MINLPWNFIKHVQSLENVVCAAERSFFSYQAIALAFFLRESHQSANRQSKAIHAMPLIHGHKHYSLCCFYVSKKKMLKERPFINTPNELSRHRVLKIVNHINCNQYFFQLPFFNCSTRRESKRWIASDGSEKKNCQLEFGSRFLLSSHGDGNWVTHIAINNCEDHWIRYHLFRLPLPLQLAAGFTHKHKPIP